MEEERTLVHGEKSKFTKVDKIDLYDDSIGYVQLWDASHSNESEAQRIHTVTQLGSIAYGNEEAKNPEALYKRLQELKHESLEEFVRPCFSGYGINDSIRNKQWDILWYESQSPYMITEHKQNIACFRIKVPIFVARQFMRHRSFSYIEMSRRYTKDSKVPFEFWFPKGFMGNIMKWSNVFITTYKKLVKWGLHTQEASRFLPQTTYTEYYCMMEIKGAKNYFKLRCDSHAQNEIRELSLGMLQLLKIHQPEFYKKVVPNDEIDSRLRDA